MVNRFGSSLYEAVADDALKDEDNAAWVTELEPEVQEEWVQRIRWIRFIDRLAEQDLLNPSSHQFYTFFMEWKEMIKTGTVPTGSIYTEILASVHDRGWQHNTAPDYALLRAWQRYLSAIARYHRPNLTIDTIHQYEMMLRTLAGAFFQLFPYLSWQYRQAACYWGAIDQFYNNLRDLHEDAAQGICYLPNELLQQYGVRREEILQLTACQNPQYHRMMRFWLDDYLPNLQRQTDEILTAQDLHPSWQILRDWSLHRYRRIEQVFRACNFDYGAFPRLYWSVVQQELPLLLMQVRQPDRNGETAAAHWHQRDFAPIAIHCSIEPLRSSSRLVRQPISA